MNHIHTTAHELLTAGIAPIPVRTDGTKRPAVTWKSYMQMMPTPDELDTWFSEPDAGLGVITGAISGNLYMIEIEGAHIDRLTELRDTAEASGLGQLWQTISTGWVEQSPSGGIHWMIRLTEQPPGNRKLAQTADRAVITETRGEGGFVVVAPTTGHAHASGKPWTRLVGSPATAPTLNAGDLEAIESVFASINEHFPTIIDAPKPAVPHNPDIDGLRPGDDFNQTADWRDILTGWEPVKTFPGGAIGWRRPGKTGPGISATTGRNPADNLYVFTSSTEFETEKAYSKFAAYTLLNHGGDYSAAARDLAKKGYGRQAPRREVTMRPAGDTTKQLLDLTPASDGTAALAPQPKPAGNIVAMPIRTITTLTDKGNADLLIHRHSHELRYLPEHGRWLAWDGTRWKTQTDDSKAVETAWNVVESINPDDDKELAKHRLKSLSRRSLEAMTGLARRDSRIRVTADDLDADPDALNTPTGIVNLTTGETTPCTPDALHSKITAVAPERQDTPLWDRFLATTFADDRELIAYLQRLIGYAATGRVIHHILPFLHGAGGNGKSAFLDTCLALLGDYATVAPDDFLVQGKDQHPTELADLMGMRLVVCSELNPGQKFDERKVKKLTGGDRVKARYMHQDFFTFEPSHTLFLMGNHQPTVASGGGESFWRRLRLLPFTRVIPPEERIPGLSERMVAEEGPGILQWIIDGALAATAGGLADPERVLAATEQYAAEEDSLGRFMNEHVEIVANEDARVSTKALRMIYTRWCGEEGERPLSAQVFGREIRQRFGVESTRSNGKRFYTGLVLLDTDELTDEEVAAHWSDR
ncbi:phage/plasmid primase, P4 family [Brevibacterium otitidis]|uniref:Phage/plasmid primase, P4 family n=1 Tax=Brevibacterium otitidis TaxID=53364 RepID=A0ABV5X6G8_9MICO|nr:hypothetical protein GCM10023233_22930 [Brevibacterium otitidis]